jgi:hypothetical protein
MREFPNNVEGSVTISAGAQDWQVFQQQDGFCDLKLSGSWACRTHDGSETVYARLVEEDSGAIVKRFAPAETSASGTWSALLPSVPAGGLYRLETCLASNDRENLEWAHRGDMRHHLGVGDLYAIAGQSNAVGFGRDPIPDPPEPGVSMLRHNGEWAMACHPLGDSTGTVFPILAERVNPGHSPWLMFAKLLRKKLGCPIGLLPLAKGGSPLSSWNPGEKGDLYENMLDFIRLAGGSVRGVLWSQGCADAGNAEAAKSYLRRFAHFVSSLRKDLNSPDLPIFIAQINRYIEDLPDELEDCWSVVREAQRQAAKSMHAVHAASTLDALVCDSIHNASATNLTLGQRFANMALRYAYGLDAACQSPDLARASLESPKEIRLEFENVCQRLSAHQAPSALLPFSVEDEEGKIGIEDCAIEANVIRLKLARRPKGAALASFPESRAFSGAVPFDTLTSLPILAFRAEIC